MKGKKVFVSGGAGVIGSEIVPKLVSMGAKVLVGDLKPRPPSFPGEVIYWQGDLNYLTQGEISAFLPDLFIHLAATFERSVESKNFWDENFWHNVRLSHHLADILIKTNNVRRIVFASSYLIYNAELYQFRSVHKIPVSLSEDDIIHPRNLTGMAKLAHEIELRFIDQHYSEKVSSVCARIYRGYGCNSRDVISRWIRLLIEGKPITVYRAEGIFDYIYASDTAEGLIRLADDDGVSGIVNLGTGCGRRVQEILDILGQYFPDMKIIYENSEIPFEASEADMSKFIEHTNWTPEHKLEDAIPKIINYERDQFDKFKLGVRATKVLLSSSNKKVPLIKALYRAVRKLDPQGSVVAGDSNENVLSSFIADEFWVMPGTHDENVDKIVEGCLERKINCVLPTRDGELLFWSRNKSIFEKYGVTVIVSPQRSLEICLDKFKFSQFGRSHKLPFIDSVMKPDGLDIKKWVVKERFGSGSRSIGLNLGKKAAIDFADQLSNPIYQPFISGKEISIDSWIDVNHKVWGTVLRNREIVADGESQVTTTFKDPIIESRVIHVLEKLKLSGPIVLQAIIDSNGYLNIIECNARIGGASTTSIKVGLDSLYWSLMEANGSEMEKSSFVRTPYEIRQVRVSDDKHFIDTDI